MTRYTQSGPQSAELFRLALQRMSEHDAAFTPFAYAVWYEHLAGINPRLSTELQRALRATSRLDDAGINALYQTCVADLDSAAAERVSAGMQRLMDGLSSTAASAGGAAAAIDAPLQGLARALGDRDVSALPTLVKETLAGSARMRDAVDALRTQVDDSRREIALLRDELVRVRQESLRCALTGVLNRKGFDECMAALFAQPEGPPEPSSLVMLDLDHFKQLNDTHGHLIGDRVLEAAGLVLRQVATEAGAAARAARFGGEEFVLLLPGLGTARARDFAEAARQGVRGMRIRQRSTDRTVQTVTISAGVATRRHDEDAAAWVARADAALYEAKRGGRDRVALG